MQSTTRRIDQAAVAAVAGNGLASRLRDAMFAAMARRHTRGVVQSLSEAQLWDSGIDRTAVLGSRPVIEVDARLATYLASLR